MIKQFYATIKDSVTGQVTLLKTSSEKKDAYALYWTGAGWRENASITNGQVREVSTSEKES
jgi:hypothetical protein